MTDTIQPNTPTVIQKLAYDVHEAAQAIGVSPVTIYRLIARGKLKSCGVLRHKIIPVNEIERFLNETLK